MTKEVSSNSDPALWLDKKPVSCEKILAVLRKKRSMHALVKELILEETLETIDLPEPLKAELVADFKEANKLNNEEEYRNFLENQNINESLLKESLFRPHKVVEFREERWGPFANSLYLKNKDKYDYITYRRLEANNPEIMQEVYFRLKDKEQTWDTMAEQFPGSCPGGLISAMPVKNIESSLVQELIAAGRGVVLRPHRVESGRFVVAQLEEIKPSKFDEELKLKILQEEFETWIEEESLRMMGKLRFAK